MTAISNMLNMSLSSRPVQTEYESTKSFLLSSSANVLNTKTKAHLLVAITSIGCSLPSSLLKAQVVEKVLRLQADVQAGTVTLQDIQNEPSNPVDRLQEACNLLKKVVV